MIKCPICSSYEIFEETTNHDCLICGETYCQGCLKICVEGEIEHNHTRNYCSKFCTLFEYLFSESFFNCCRSRACNDPKEYFFMTIIFLFCNPAMFTKKYFNFFQNNHISENCCVHWFFTYLNLFANILYCVVYNILSIELFSFILFPSIFCCSYYEIIIYNWNYVYRFDVGECPITELTVRGKGYHFYLI